MMKLMKIHYDNHADAAYIYIADKITNGSVKKTYACDISETDHMINLDFDNQGRLIGIEVLDASKCLPKESLRSAEKI